jgi:hypothetical protein
VIFDTTDILLKIDAEKVSHEELENAKPYMKRCEAFTSLKLLPMLDETYICLYILKMKLESGELNDVDKFRKVSQSKF